MNDETLEVLKNLIDYIKNKDGEIKTAGEELSARFENAMNRIEAHQAEIFNLKISYLTSRVEEIFDILAKNGLIKKSNIHADQISSLKTNVDFLNKFQWIIITTVLTGFITMIFTFLRK